MKILLLADANSSHTVKWAISLVKKGVEINIFSLNDYDSSLYVNFHTIKLFSVGKKGANKLKYLQVLSDLKKVIRKFNPDIVHAHYASSYGLLGALSKFHPFILSVWGSDVYDFPLKSILHKKIIQFNLKKADKILSTSKAMAHETKKYTKKGIEITPFGIDTTIFCKKKVETLFAENEIVIGTVKALEKVYGIDIFIQAFAILKNENPELPLKLLLVGSGSEKKNLQNLVKKLQLENDTIFVGKVKNTQVANYHNMLTIFVALSRSESFGVSVIEALACEIPVVVTNVGGLPEVVSHNKTGFVVAKENPMAAAKAIKKLIVNKNLTLKMGKSGREEVQKKYEWNNNVTQMLSIYQKF